MKNLIQEVVNEGIRAGVVESEKKEIYLFGVYCLVFSIINGACALLIGCLFSVPAEMLLYVFLFSSIRRYTGGHHAKSTLRCFVNSQALNVVAALFISNQFNLPLPIYLILGAIALATILFWAPVAAPNNPLSDIERKVFKRKAVLISTCAYMISLVFYSLLPCMVFVAMTSLSIANILLVVGLIQMKLSVYEARNT